MVIRDRLLRSKEKKSPTGVLKPIDLSNIQTEKLSFTKYYVPTSLDITPQVSPYQLPLQASAISNFKNFSVKVALSQAALRLLEKNGFVVIDNPFTPKGEDITIPYKILKDREIPIFITSDSLLHLYHIQFDETLRQIEEREFYDMAWQISRELLEDSIEQYKTARGDVKEALKRNVAYFAVGLNLLKPKQNQFCQRKHEWECTDAYFKKEELDKYNFTIPNFVKKEVQRELALIEKHEGFSQSPLFVYPEDYSQYIPRGHYTRSEKLKNYFKAFMWYGRISMLLRGTDQVKPGQSCSNVSACQALISLYDAKIQTMQACLISSKFSESKDLRDKWDRIYSVTAFYVGLSDDLGPYEYIEALRKVLGDSFSLSQLDTRGTGDIKAKLAEYQPPKIYGGTGNCAIDPPFSPQDADRCLEVTGGFRLMGQRFIPDSYMFSNLVGTYTGVYLGKDKPFTLVISGAGIPIRGFPRGLDVMALLGSERAKELLSELDDSHYKDYAAQYKRLQEEFDSFTPKEWNKNLYWSWLYSLKSLLKKFEQGYPTFMQTKTWQDKELTTALASWAQLRHDTILYAKQSYTMRVTSALYEPPQRPVVGYIEPVPEFYSRLLALTRMTNKGLTQMGVLDESSKLRLDNLEKILVRLEELSKKELENQELQKADYDFIKNFGEELNGVIAEVDQRAKKTTIIADVHTDANTGQVLEEATGYVKLIVVAYKVADGRILVGAGPVLSYYEFKHPMQDRLTDEKWRQILQFNPPQEPEWIHHFAQ
ncbi:MAG: DUF3160 domain-containing protein [Candidatus Omnitrophota bacterium]|nr:MAG: DUF3160 domain-containing protein [Candidatus Omnitrophota bacterium]